jgi:hypothetical protein
MPGTEISSEFGLSMFDLQAEILRELQKQNGIRGVLQHCSFNSMQVVCRVGSIKPSDLMHTEGALRMVMGSYEDFCFENRKKRPHERGRKKRRKGKWHPMDRLWNSADSNSYSSGFLIEQN